VVLPYLIQAVFVAGGAGVVGVAGGCVAGGARQFALFAVIEWEGVLPQLGWKPCVGGVAVSAVGTKDAEVDRWLDMASDAFGWCAFECLVSMTGCAFLGGVLAGEWPYLRVIKASHLSCAIVAFLARSAKQRGVFGDEGWVWLVMASLAIRIRNL